MSYRFGMEIEVSVGGGDVLSILYEDGHVTDGYLHDYHCSCSSCRHYRSGPDWTAQDDCTADAEFISRILTTGPEGDEALAVMSAALIQGRSEHSSEVGMHVHTDAEPFRDDHAAVVRLWRLWLTYEDDIGTLARMSADRVRSYNAPCRVQGVLGYESHGREQEMSADFYTAEHGDAYEMLHSYVKLGNRSGRWLSGGTGEGTWEFRVWNGTRSLWRMRMAVYVSVALTVAALDGYEARPDDGRSLLHAIGDYLPEDVVMSIVKQLAFVYN